MNRTSYLLVRVLSAAIVLVYLGGVAAAQDASAQRQTAWRELVALKNQDLEKLVGRARDRLDEIADLLVTDHDSSKSFDRPKYFWELSGAKGKHSFVMLEITEGCSLPGRQRGTFFFFDSAGVQIGQTAYVLGWRMCETDIKTLRRDDLNLNLAEIESSGMGFSYANNSKVYFALFRDRAVLVHLESEKRDSFLDLDNRNSYGCPHPAIGPETPVRSADEWANVLRSSDPVAVLDALLWLGGHHSSFEELHAEQAEWDEMRVNHPDLKDFPTTLERCPGVIDDARLIFEVQARPEVQDTLLKLSDSPIDWIRQGAMLARTPIKRRVRS